MRINRYPILVALAAALALPAAAQEKKAETGKSESAKADANEPEEDIARASAEEDAQPKRGSVTVKGRTIAYTATPGTLTIRDDDGEAVASMFYVAYVADRPKGSAPRPVTFTFNGGPGSSSMWLHMGSIGPVLVETPNAGSTAPAPYRIRSNPETMLDKTDIVFLDAIGTGLSRPIGKSKGPEFWGVDQDIDAFSRAIMRYLTLNDRWDSPKFLFGESYGTLRGAGLVYALQQRGVQMNGVVLLSSILNYGVRQPGYDQIYLTYLPSYAATAWYHNRLANKPAALEPFLTEVRQWTTGPYAAALAKGSDLGDEERNAVAQQMSAYTGLPVKYILDADLRVELSRFRKELMRDQKRTVGRLDSRFIGIDVDAAGEGPEFDTTDAAISGPYVGALNKYLFGTLGYKTKLAYRPNYYVKIGGGNWDQRHRAPGGRQGGAQMALANTALDLSAAMRQNPYLKVLSLNGYYDMATPFFGAEYDLKHMQIDPSLRANLTYHYYESGHMVYINPAVIGQFKRDLDAFYDSAAVGN
ncbi:peptidase S10 [Sphingopyxis sp. H038]|uniref:S10 family peptidase n=1 Tax=unclassified Sphingopyxis TaxID=2614943 RepID=UPI0007303046|nr:MULTISPECIES: peptidase S10 [unclassified Sphingopyxis]KTE02430.1 peptidase S10 [Sphingopyxis sp. H012]KTE09585.1 peptidase S10 [Sphingopyxis sp. H093]KTE10991.1 peptidase S10 [Sphingopyxis sp. H053]KTE26023.1 peptidase S10 [Sphingopyxis sp. H080]KTE35479.1 peptidase S10 [Sphingopyxis sp. H038]